MKDFYWYWVSFKWWFKDNFPIYINTLNIFRPYKEWRKVKKYFKKPSIKIRGCEWDAFPFIYSKIDPKLFAFVVNELSWKSKFGDYRHEENPNIMIGLFWKWIIYFDFRNPSGDDKDDTMYWEAVLDKAFGNWNYKEKRNEKLDIYQVYKNNIWTRQFLTEDPEQITIYPYLTKSSQKFIDEKLKS